MNDLINNVSVDCVVFGFHNRKLSIMLTKRELKDEASGEFLVSDYSLQGHHIQKGENLDDAAKRILNYRTGLDNIFLKQFYTFGSTDRLLGKKDKVWLNIHSPWVNEYVITVAYFALVDSSLVNPDDEHPAAKWFPVNKLPKLAFDHKKIILVALDYLRDELRREPISYELLPEKFTLTQLQYLYEAILGVRLDKRNFRKKVMQMRYIIPLDEKLADAGSKPAQLFIFSRDVYERTKKEKLDFSI
jgi:8-oxo-dGTP diphosphatase